MTIGIGDRLVKVRGTNEEIRDRIRQAIFLAAMSDGEVTADELLDQLCPGEAYVEFEATSPMAHDGGFSVSDLKNQTRFSHKVGNLSVSHGSVNLAVLR